MKKTGPNSTNKDKPKFSFWAFLKKRIDAVDRLFGRFFSWIAGKFKKQSAEEKTLQSLTLTISDAQGEVAITCNRTDSSEAILNRYLKARNIPLDQAGSLVWTAFGTELNNHLPFRDRVHDYKHPNFLKLNYIPKDHLGFTINKSGDVKDTMVIVPDTTPVSAVLQEYEKEHNIPENQTGMLFAYGKSANPNQTLKSLSLAETHFLSLSYLAPQTAYIPTLRNLIIKDNAGQAHTLQCDSTETIEEVLTKFHESCKTSPSITADQMETLSFLGTNFKEKQVVGEILALAEQQKHTGDIVMNHGIKTEPIYVRIGQEKETYRLKCDATEPLNEILKKYHAMRHTDYEEGTLKYLSMNAKQELVVTKLDNTKTLAEHNILAGDEVRLTYSSPSKTPKPG